MSSNLTPTERNSQINKTLSTFDRGSCRILNYFSPLTKSEVISLQVLFFALLEILSLNLMDNDPVKSRSFFELLIYFLRTSNTFSSSMSLSARSIRQVEIFQDYVRILQDTIKAASNLIRRSSTQSNQSTFPPLLEIDFAKVLLSTQPSPNIRIDIPQQDIQLKTPIPLTMKQFEAINNFDNIVVFRYVQDFYELNKLGKGAFGSVFRARNRLDDQIYAMKKIVFNENTHRTRWQAEFALREVRVLASLSHPNIVQYHCAWLELVPTETRARQTTTLSSSQIEEHRPQAQQFDSLDDLIEFDRQSSSLSGKKNENDGINSSQKSSTTSTDNEDESEVT